MRTRKSGSLVADQKANLLDARGSFLRINERNVPYVSILYIPSKSSTFVAGSPFETSGAFISWAAADWRRLVRPAGGGARVAVGFQARSGRKVMGGLIGMAPGMRAVPMRHRRAGLPRDQRRNHDEPEGHPHFSSTNFRLLRHR